MKVAIVAVLIAVVMGALVATRDQSPTSYVKEQVEVVKEVEVTPDWATDEDAVKAAQAVIRKKELEAERGELQSQIAEIEAEAKAQVDERKSRITEINKELGTFWRDVENLRQEVRVKAEEYGVSANTMMAIINCESGWDYTIQSRHVYTATNVPPGYKVGDREQSFGLVQIHLPAHPTISKEQAIDPEFALDFLAKNLRDGKASMWTCAKKLALGTT